MCVYKRKPFVSVQNVICHAFYFHLFLFIQFDVSNSRRNHITRLVYDFLNLFLLLSCATVFFAYTIFQEENFTSALQWYFDVLSLTLRHCGMIISKKLYFSRHLLIGLSILHRLPKLRYFWSSFTEFARFKTKAFFGFSVSGILRDQPFKIQASFESKYFLNRSVNHTDRPR